MSFLLTLWCAGKLGNCPSNLTRFRFTCLYCRWRRHYYGKFTVPPFWIEYVYKSLFTVQFVNQLRRGNIVYKAPEGKKLKYTRRVTLKIDPRGCFTAVRCAIIMVLDNLMKKFHIKKPLAEFCELFANYPVWSFLK